LLWHRNQAFWPIDKLYVASEEISYLEYFHQLDDKYEFLNTMVGDLQRIKIYPDKGFQIFQDIPDDVWQAYQNLVRLGFDERLIHAI